MLNRTPTVSRTLRAGLPGWIAAILLALAAVAGAEDRVYPSPEAVQPLQPGSLVPAVRVESVAGERVDLAEQVQEHGALLVFYRGGW